MAQVIVENVYKSYSRSRIERDDGSRTTDKDRVNKSKQVSVLRDINFTAGDGEFLVLVGPSGCGKSTLLRLLAGLEELTGGNIEIGDRLVNDLPPKERDIAMVFQNYALYPHLNIYDNIAFGLRRNNKTRGRGDKGTRGQGEKGTRRQGDRETRGQGDEGTGRQGDRETRGQGDKGTRGQGDRETRGQGGVNASVLEDFLSSITRKFPRSLRYMSAKEKSIRDRVRYVASLLQIEALLYRLPKELSGGQKQRVALGRAIARNPEVFLMDEPLSNLDAKLRTQTRAQIVKLQRQLNTTTIYVTHDQTEAMTMGDRIAVMNNGKIQQIDAPLEIYNHPANLFVAQFIGSPPMNFLPVDVVNEVKLVHQHFELDLPEVWRSSIGQSKAHALTLGIRPQHLYLAPEGQSNIQIEVDLVEALGNETYVSAHLVADIDVTLTVSLPPDKIITIGDILWLAIDLDKIHLFAVDDGRAIALK